ncbi:MAG: hypothetical protein C1943_05755 [Halochromatium sp.]|nr:hypothetical protein [Halochromatium sp.]
MIILDIYMLKTGLLDFIVQVREVTEGQLVFMLMLIFLSIVQQMLNLMGKSYQEQLVLVVDGLVVNIL